MAEVDIGIGIRAEKHQSSKEHIYSITDSTTAMRFGKEYPGGGLEEFRAISRLHNADPLHVVRPITLLRDNKDQVIGYKSQEIEGQTAYEYMQTKGELPKKYSSQIEKALVTFHNAGLAHGDVNPHNIIISNDGVIKFIDPVGYGEIKNDELSQCINDDWKQLRSWLPKKRNTIISRLLR